MTNKIKDDSQEMTGKDFRPKYNVDSIAEFPKEDGYTYKGVCFTYRHLPNNVEDHEKAGYEIVYDKRQAKDDRKFTPDNNLSDSTVPGPVIKSTSDGQKYLLMRIPTEKFDKLKQKQADNYEDNYLNSVKGKVRRNSKGEVHVDGGELNLNNNNGDSK